MTGTLAWVDRLKWSGLPDFKKAPRVPLYPPSGKADLNTGAFLQKYENFHFYWIMDAGHMVGFDVVGRVLACFDVVCCTLTIGPSVATSSS